MSKDHPSAAGKTAGDPRFSDNSCHVSVFYGYVFNSVFIHLLHFFNLYGFIHFLSKSKLEIMNGLCVKLSQILLVKCFEWISITGFMPDIMTYDVLQYHLCGTSDSPAVRVFPG